MRQWDGGPKDVKGYGGFFGGAAAGLAGGVAQIGLAEWKQEKQMELAKFESDAARALKSEEWDREDARAEKSAIAAGLLKGEEIDREDSRAATKRGHEEQMQERLWELKGEFESLYGKDGSGNSETAKTKAKDYAEAAMNQIASSMVATLDTGASEPPDPEKVTWKSYAASAPTAKRQQLDSINTQIQRVIAAGGPNVLDEIDRILESAMSASATQDPLGLRQ